MKHEASIVVGPLEFEGLSNELIFVEIDQEADALGLLKNPLSGKVSIIFMPRIEYNIHPNYDFTSSVFININSLYEAYKAMRDLRVDIDYFIIDRIDHMDTTLHARERGIQQAAFISMIAAPKILRGSNLVITSSYSEQTLKKKADRCLNLKTKN